MVSKRQLKQVYPLTERAHIMVSTMIWVGLINPPFEVPLGQKGVPLSVSLDHRFTSLGAATAFILWKKEEKQSLETKRRSTCWMEDLASPGWGWQLSQTCVRRVALQGHRHPATSAQQRRLTWHSRSVRRGHAQRYPVSCTLGFQCCSCSQITCVLLLHLETTLPFSPADHCQVATSLLHLSTQRKN